MAQYSLVINSPLDIAIPEPLLLLGVGLNVVSVFTDDIEATKALIEAEGCTINEVNFIEVESTTASDMLLDGEDPKILGAD